MCYVLLFFFFNDTATTEIYTLSLHDALPICELVARDVREPVDVGIVAHPPVPVAATQPGRLDPHDGAVPSRLGVGQGLDRKSTRLNSSHANISYAVFCLKKKKAKPQIQPTSH